MTTEHDYDRAINWVKGFLQEGGVSTIVCSAILHALSVTKRLKEEPSDGVVNAGHAYFMDMKERVQYPDVRNYSYGVFKAMADQLLREEGE